MTDLEKVLGKTGARKFWDKVWGNVKILTGDVAYNTKGDLQTQINAVADTASTAKTTADAAKTAAEDAKVAAGEIVTDTTDKFDSTKDYAVGDYVIYDNKAWKFTTVHPAGAWDESHVEQTNILAEIAAQNKNFAELNKKLTSVIGFPDYSNSEILITNKKGSGTITENGWLAINESGASSEVSVKINNKITYSVRLANSLMIPVSSGDTWEVAYFTANYYLWFIQNKTI